MTRSSSPTRRIVITGGPGSGKTTLVSALSEAGYATVPEAAIEVIDDLNREHGVEGQVTWRRANGRAFQALILERQIQWEKELGPTLGPVFLDRGLHDGLAYCRYRGDDVPAGLLKALEGWSYDAVFVLSTLSQFDARKATGRTSSRADSIAIAGKIVAVYEEYGMRSIIVPEASVEERVQCVLRALEA